MCTDLPIFTKPLGAGRIIHVDTEATQPGVAENDKQYSGAEDKRGLPERPEHKLLCWQGRQKWVK